MSENPKHLKTEIMKANIREPEDRSRSYSVEINRNFRRKKKQ